MTDIFLLRHGKSDWDVDFNDYHRPLKDRGKRAAQRVANWMLEHDLIPEQVWSSPAKRAIETAEKAVKVMGFSVSEIESVDALYEASSSTLLAQINRARESQKKTLIVGHNPSIEQALKVLVDEQLPITKLDKLVPTGTLAHLTFEQNNVTLRNLVHPRTLPKKFAVNTAWCQEADRPAYYFTQSGVIPYRWDQRGKLVFLLITKSNKAQWGVPKGIVEPGYSPEDSAAKEAQEEAGIFGELDNQAVGCYYHDKWGGRCQITLYPMEVKTMMGESGWESYKRTRQWFTLNEAIELIVNPDLQNMLKTLAQRLGAI